MIPANAALKPSINAALLLACHADTFVATEEGDRLKAYQDQGGVWTIGCGHTGPDVYPGLVITHAQEVALLHADLLIAENWILHEVTVPLNAHEFDALTSFCYNIGRGGFAASTVLRRLNAGDREGAANAMLMWNEVDHKENAGLTNRRNAERKLFLTPVPVGTA